MYLINVSDCFDAAHFLSGYEGKCSNIHGHRWTIDICINSEELISEGNQKGMVIDFTKLKSEIKKMVNEYDHSFI